MFEVWWRSVDWPVNGVYHGSRVCGEVNGVAQRIHSSPGTLLGCLSKVREFSLLGWESSMSSLKNCQAACVKVELCGMQK